jgi:hypothetical protein
MKTFVSISLLICSILIVGCRKQENPPNTPPVPQASTKPGDNLATAPVDYLARAGKAEQSMEKRIDTTSLNSAIQLFNVQEGRYPTDLNELVTKKYLGKLPTPPFGSKLQYDAKEGKVTVVKE